jgi:hypothetical protein
MRFVTTAGVLGCASFAAIAGLPAAAAGTTIYLTIHQSVQGPVSGGVTNTAQTPAHEYRLENFSQSGPTFKATTPLDGSSSYIPSLSGQNLKELVVRVDGHTMDDAFYFTDCTLKSDKVTANSSSAVLKLSFVCGKMGMHVVQVTPSPRPSVPVLSPLNARQMLVPPAATPTPK